MYVRCGDCQAEGLTTATEFFGHALSLDHELEASGDGSTWTPFEEYLATVSQQTRDG